MTIPSMSPPGSSAPHSTGGRPFEPGRGGARQALAVDFFLDEPFEAVLPPPEFPPRSAGMAAAAIAPAATATPAAIAVFGLSRARSAILPAPFEIVVRRPPSSCGSSWAKAWGMALLGMLDIYASPLA